MSLTAELSRSGTLAIYTAKVFATAAHAAIDQRRKYTNAPYIMHPEAVAGLVETVEGHTVDMVCTAWLHDVLEDTKVDFQTLDNVFGRDVADMVNLLTDVGHEHGNRAKRKAYDRDRIAGAPGSVQTVKVADLIDNTSTIVQFDRDFAKVYLREKRELLDVLTGADEQLWSRANLMVTRALHDLQT